MLLPVGNSVTWGNDFGASVCIKGGSGSGSGSGSAPGVGLRAQKEQESGPWPGECSGAEEGGHPGKKGAEPWRLKGVGQRVVGEDHCSDSWLSLALSSFSYFSPSALLLLTSFPSPQYQGQV